MHWADIEAYQRVWETTFTGEELLLLKLLNREALSWENKNRKQSAKEPKKVSKPSRKR